MRAIRGTMLIACALVTFACALLPSETPQIAMPLRTAGATIVDATGARIRLRGVNWFGAESAEFVVGGLDRQPLREIVALVRRGGFNSVRLPWSNEMLRRDPIVEARYLAANPGLHGKSALEVFDAVIQELGKQGLMVILDNHRSRGDWCCDEEHGDGLWHSREYPEAFWLEDWRAMAARYRDDLHVVAAELRNEVRADPALGLKPTWGDGNEQTDWRAAAERGGNAVLAVNPNLLIVVGGIDYQQHLAGVRKHPVRLSRADRLVYAAHDYAWWHSTEELSDDLAFSAALKTRWDYVRQPGQDFTAPVYISEWGGCVQSDSDGRPCLEDRAAFVRAFTRYAANSDIDWAYWPLNGTQSTGYGRTRGAVETYGLLNRDWSDYADADLVSELIGGNQ